MKRLKFKTGNKNAAGEWCDNRVPEERTHVFEGRKCAPGEIGEIYFRPDAGRESAGQYIGASAKSLGEWLSYGDLGHVDEEGYLYLAERRSTLSFQASEQLPEYAAALICKCMKYMEKFGNGGA